LLIFERDFCDQKRIGISLVENKIENTYEVNRFEIEIPFPSFLTLRTDRMGNVIKRTIFEVVLFRLLHFDDKLFRFVVFAIDLKHRSAIYRRGAEQLRIPEFQCVNLVPLREQCIQKVRKKTLARLFAEQFFETEVRVRIDVTCHDVILPHPILDKFIQKYKRESVITSL